MPQSNPTPLLHDLAESLEADGPRLRLPDGRALSGLPGWGKPSAARRPYHPGDYENDEDGQPDKDQLLTILAWGPRRQTALQNVTLDDDRDNPGHMACNLSLTSAEHPQPVRRSVKFQTSCGRWTKYAGGHPAVTWSGERETIAAVGTLSDCWAEGFVGPLRGG